MRDFDRRETPAHLSCGATKRKCSYNKSQKFGEDPHNCTKRRKSANPQTKTLTPKTARSLTLPGLVVSEPLRPRASNSGKRKRRNRSSNDRKWIFSSRDFSNLNDRAVVVSYNILGVENASKHPDLYIDVPAKCLDWNRRKYLITKEISRYNAGIICLQEVDHFNDLDDLFQKDGFKGVYKARTGDASDGCAIFWKEELFTLLHHEEIEFQNFGLRNNVAQLCILKMNSKESESELCIKSAACQPVSSRRVVVGNIHVLFNPNRGDIKLGQVRLFLDKAYKLSQEWGDIPVIIGGDFNSIPRSAMYQFMASSQLDINLHDRRQISGQLEYELNWRDSKHNATSVPMHLSRTTRYKWSVEELRFATGSEAAMHIQHRLKLCSACNGIRGNSRTRDCCGEPLATSYHSRFMGTVDYIWHSGDLVPVRVLEPLPIDVLKRSRGLPNEHDFERQWVGHHSLGLVLFLEYQINEHFIKDGAAIILLLYVNLHSQMIGIYSNANARGCCGRFVSFEGDSTRSFGIFV